MRKATIAFLVLVSLAAAAGCGGAKKAGTPDPGPADTGRDPGSDAATDATDEGDATAPADAGDAWNDAPLDAPALPDLPDLADDVGPPDLPAPDLATDVPECAVDADCKDKLAVDGPCRVARCEAGRCVEGTAAPGTACDDGSKCTTGDACADGVCKGTAVECMDGNVCTADSCDPATGCVNVPAPAKCDDGQSCTVFDQCVGGECVGTARDCDDGDPCTTDMCAEGVGCVHFANTASCDDLNDCTTGDKCAAGVCRGKPVACTDPPANECSADGKSMVSFANPGVCVQGACAYPANVTGCDAGCDAGLCKGVAPCANVDCSQAPSPCLAAPGTCANGRCTYAYEDGAECDDGSLCTGGEACLGGACVGLPKVCNDPPADTCTDPLHLQDWSRDGKCDPDTGTCAYVVSPTTCGGGCMDGACLDGSGLLQGDLTPWGGVGLSSASYSLSCVAQPGFPGGRASSAGWTIEAGFEP